jgi:hypothetical protein
LVFNCCHLLTDDLSSIRLMGTLSRHSNNRVIHRLLSMARALRHWGTFEEGTVNGSRSYVLSILHSNPKSLMTSFVRGWFPSSDCKLTLQATPIQVTFAWQAHKFSLT